MPSVTNKHPAYDAAVPDWRTMRLAYAGERAVKEAGIERLPPTSGMIEDGALTAVSAAVRNKGQLAYDAYRMRARFPDVVREAVEAVLGVMHNKPPVIELPAQLEYLRERATNRGESLAMLLRRVNEQQLTVGRIGLLGDVVSTGRPGAGNFYVTTYAAETAINWDDDARGGTQRALNLVVLDETSVERIDVFTWEEITKHRVLALGDPRVNEPAGATSTYRFALLREKEELTDADLVEASVAGRKATEIPFVFINDSDIASETSKPPLLGLADLAFGIYRGEADYRQGLYMQGQDTFVVIGGVAGQTDQTGQVAGELRTGAGARVDVPIGGDAKYVGVSSAGLPEQRAALEADYARAAEKAGQMLDTTSRAKESGEALKIRVAARTATLHTIAGAGAYGLQTLLRKLATWIGVDPETVVVTPNLDFVDAQLTGKELAELVAAKLAGAPIAFETIHQLMAQRGMTELSFEDEIAKIQAEGELDLVPRTSTNPDGPVEDNPDDNPDAPVDGDPASGGS